MTKQILLPQSGLVLLVGPSNSGKTTLLNRLVDQGVLAKTEIVSSDQFRLLVADTEFIEFGKRPKEEQDILYAHYQRISQKAFEAMEEIINIRCALGKLTVVDATNLHPDDRKKYMLLAEKNNVRAWAIALDIPEKILLDRDVHYAHVAEVAFMDRKKLLEKLQLAKNNGWAVDPWIEETLTKLENAEIFQKVFQNYCWDTNGTTGIQIAPFHILAHSDKTFFAKSHIWHMEQSKYLATLSRLFIQTEYRVVKDEKSEEEATHWWREMTEQGHEGFVVKPESFIAKNDKGKPVQPAIKVRGRKYLHIIYGIDYLAPDNLVRLKQRNVGKKQRHALMEFALGIEGVQRFIRKEPIARVHECVLATLALEADPVDPRL